VKVSVKDRRWAANHPVMEVSPPVATEERGPPDIGALHDAHADFVWATLHRMGVREADLPDMMQEVFVVIHRRLHSFDGSAKITSWIYGICRKVASTYRRRAHIRKEDLVEEMPPGQSVASSEEELQAAQTRQTLERVLNQMDVDRRVTFVMYEIDGLPGEQIAETLGVPIGTVYSRLHKARKEFEKVLAAMERVPVTRQSPVVATRKGGRR